MANNRKMIKKHDSNQINIDVKPEENGAALVARTMLNPMVHAATTLKAYDKAYGDIDLNRVVASLAEQTQATSAGDLGRAEAMLTSQAHTLDAIFNNLAKRAIKAEYINQLDQYLKLALRAQSQSRATWEALAAIKNPPIMGYVRQANIAQGPQQVNNEQAVSNSTSRARKIENLQNKLMEKEDGERMDFGTPGTAGKEYSELETLGEIDRSKEQSR